MNGIHLEAPVYLYGLIALGIPFLLLLSKARTFQKNDFSSVEFLRQITEKASNQIEWKKLLLLMTRLLLIFFLVLAFALPFVRQSQGGFFGNTRERLLIIIDHSMSMSYVEDGQSLLEKAKMMAKEKIKQLDKPYRSIVVYSFDRGLHEEGYVEKDQKGIETKINQINQTDLESKKENLDTDLMKLLEEDKNSRYVVWLFSDFQNFHEDLSQNVSQKIKDLGYDVNLKYYPIQPHEYVNFSLQTIKFSNRPFISGMKQPIDVFFNSVGYPKNSKVNVELWVDGHAYHQQEVEIPESGKGKIRFWIQMPAPGNYRIEVKAHLDADPLISDNHQYAVIAVNDPMRILIIKENEYEYPFENPYYFFNQALKSQSDENAYDSWVEIISSSIEEIAEMDLLKYQMIVLADLTDFQPRALSSLRYYLKEGGNLFFAVGENFDPKIYQSQPQLSKLLGGYFSPKESPSKIFHLKPINYAHPSLRIFDHGKLGDLSQIVFYQIAKFNPIQTENNFHTIAWFDDDWPALVEMTEGKGKTFVFMSSLNTDWNTFPKSPLYLPWVSELMKYALLGENAYPQTYEPGDALALNRHLINDEMRLQLKLPSGDEVALYRAQLNGVYEQRLTQFKGFYEWILQNKIHQEQKIVAYNPSPLESLPNTGEVFQQHEGLDEISETVQNHHRTYQKHYLYTNLFYFVFILLLFEAWIANRFYQSNLKKVAIKHEK